MNKRRIASKVLQKVLKQGLTIDQSIQSYLEKNVLRISTSDRNWILEVVSGAVRSKRRLELAMDAYAEKKKATGQMRDLLLLAAYQLIECPDLPAPAIVHEWVEEVKMQMGKGPSQYANAILRKLSRQAEGWKKLAISDSASASLPDWIWKRLVADWGMAKAIEIASSQLQRPRFFLYGDATILKAWQDQKWIKDFAEWEESSQMARACILELGSILESKELKAGKVWLQDITAQEMVSQVAIELKKQLKERMKIQGNSIKFKILDLCAAPGGKILSLYRKLSLILSHEELAKITWTATDKDFKKLNKMKSDFLALQLPIQVVSLEDISNSKFDFIFDFIWVDAPCSGTGVLRKHPEGRWIRQEADLNHLIQTQQECLEFALQKSQKGGSIVYSVCSVLKAEGQEVVDKIIATFSASSLASSSSLPLGTPRVSSSLDSNSGAVLSKIQSWVFCDGHQSEGDGFLGCWLRLGAVVPPRD